MLMDPSQIFLVVEPQWECRARDFYDIEHYNHRKDTVS